MMPENINKEAQEKRCKDAIGSAVSATITFLINAGVVMFVRWYFQINGAGGRLLWIISVAELGMIIPVWILLRKRLKEIEGGEEDVAAQY